MAYVWAHSVADRHYEYEQICKRERRRNIRDYIILITILFVVTCCRQCHEWSLTTGQSTTVAFTRDLSQVSDIVNLEFKRRRL